jgi:hypothetical protein
MPIQSVAHWERVVHYYWEPIAHWEPVVHWESGADTASRHVGNRGRSVGYTMKSTNAQMGT